jgi:hypothetical protein
VRKTRKDGATFPYLMRGGMVETNLGRFQTHGRMLPGSGATTRGDMSAQLRRRDRL